MSVIQPGSTIGIIGGGQLARMIALEARRMGYRIAVLDPDGEGSAAQVSDLHVPGDLDDLSAARKLAACADVVTIDTEHVPADLLAALESVVSVRPGANVLRVVQDRLRQREFLAAHDLPQPRFASIACAEDIATAAATVGFPAVLKTRHEGYDGKGQARVGSASELEAAWRALGRPLATLEAFVSFTREISVILARGVDGRIRFYPIAENRHRDHILHTSLAPAECNAQQIARAESIGARIATALGHVGMMAVELFETAEGGLLVNEIAPRTHNSGHYTFGACATSQFEQHVRAICGLPLGDPTLLQPAVMLNLLGDLWRDGEPDWDGLLADPRARLHVYGKNRAMPGRKMGHVLALDATRAGAWEAIAAIERRLASGGADGTRAPRPVAHREATLRL